MTTTRTSRRAEDFDRALSGGRVDPALAGLVAVAGALATLPQKPAPAFREALRTRLMAEAAQLAATPAASIPAQPTGPVSPARSLPRLLQHPAMQVATGGLAATIAATGIGVGASRSVPGDTLYGLKRAVEDLQVGAAGGDQAEAGALIEHAQTRLDEVRELLSHGDLSGAALRRVEDTLRALDAELRRATSRLLSEARNGSRAAFDELNRVTQDIADQLAALLPGLPDGAATVASGSLATLNAARALLAAMPAPGTRPGPVVSDSPSVRPTSPPPTSTTPTTVPPPTSTGPIKVPPTSVPVTTPPISVPVTTPPPIVVTTPPTLPITLPPVLP